MRKNVRTFVELSEKIFNLQPPIYEFGAYQMDGQENVADLRPLFKNKVYIGCDARSGKGVDRVEDVQSIHLEDESAATVLLVDTAEHVKRPQKAIQEIHRILKPGGILVMASVMDFPIHHHPYDYWRFTPEGFNALLESFERKLIGWQGEGKFPHTIFGIGIKKGFKQNPEKYFEDFCSAKDCIQTSIGFKPWKKRLVGSLLRAPFFKTDSFFKECLARYVSYDEISFKSYP